MYDRTLIAKNFCWLLTRAQRGQHLAMTNKVNFMVMYGYFRKEAAFFVTDKQCA